MTRGTLLLATLVLFNVAQKSSGEHLLLATLYYGDSQILLTQAAQLLSQTGHKCTLLFYGTVHPWVSSALRPGSIDVVLFPFHPLDPLAPILGSNGSSVASAVPFEEDWASYSLHVPEVLLESGLLGCESVLSRIDQVKETGGEYLMATLYLEDQCWLGLAEALKLPVLGLVTDPLATVWAMHQAGQPTPLSHVPVLVTDMQEKMDFFNRLTNLERWVTFLRAVGRKYQEQAKVIVKKYVSTIQPLEEMYQRMAIVFHHSNAMLEPAQPVYDFVVRVGTFHCLQPQNLTQDLIEFVRHFNKGIIYVSVENPYTSLPKSTVEAILTTSKRVPYGFLWQSRGLNQTVLPENVLMRRDLSESDVLGHPRTKLFIGRCSPSQVQSALFYGIPIICIPHTFSEKIMASRILYLQVGIQMDRDFITSPILLNAINTILRNKSFRSKMVHMSQDIQDQPLSAANQMAYWVDYVIRHKGHTHFRSLAADSLSFFEYYLVDIVLFLVLVTVVGMITIIFSCFIAIRYFLAKRKTKDE